MMMSKETESMKAQPTVDVPLMQRLLDAGYPAEDIEHHESDLYVFVTPLTKKVIEEWCQEHGYDRKWQCPIFKDQVSGRGMYDCAFQYSDWWAEKAGMVRS